MASAEGAAYSSPSRHFSSEKQAGPQRDARGRHFVFPPHPFHSPWSTAPPSSFPSSRLSLAPSRLCRLITKVVPPGRTPCSCLPRRWVCGDLLLNYLTVILGAASYGALLQGGSGLMPSLKWLVRETRLWEHHVLAAWGLSAPQIVLSYFILFLLTENFLGHAVCSQLWQVPLAADLCQPRSSPPALMRYVVRAGAWGPALPQRWHLQVLIFQPLHWLFAPPLKGLPCDLLCKKDFNLR